MKYLLETPKLLIIIFLFILVLPSCNNEELFVVEESVIKEEDVSTDEEDEPTNEDEVILVDVIDDTFDTIENVPVELVLFENDISLPEAGSLSYTNPENGVLTVNDNNTVDNNNDDVIAYTPKEGFFGTDSFEYTLCDSLNPDNCDTALVVINIKENDVDFDDEFSTELKAFPSAYGAGSNITGGRGGAVYYVTTREDTATEGSFRWAITRQGPRTVVFKVGGEFELTLGRLKLTGGLHDNLTIAGQTAPGDGVTITGNYLAMQNVDNIIMRYVRFRGLKNATLGNSDIITGTGCTNIIIDHCSGSWGEDEIWSFTTNDPAKFVTNISIQRSVLAECDPSHNTATIMGNSRTDDSLNETGEFSWNNNYVYNISHRFPNVAGHGKFEIKNNVIYNWKYRLTSAYYRAEVNQQNNFYKAGPVTIAQGYSENGDGLIETLNRVGNYGSPPKIFAKGNLVYPDLITDPNADNTIMWRWFSNSEGKSRGDRVPDSLFLSSEPQALGFELPLLPAIDSYMGVLNDVGANKSLNEDGSYTINLDKEDESFIEAALNDNGATSYREMSEWILTPLVDPNNDTSYLDTDKDGLPDIWENMRDYLDANDASDGKLDEDGDGYTNLEEFLNRVDI